MDIAFYHLYIRHKRNDQESWVLKIKIQHQKKCHPLLLAMAKLEHQLRTDQKAQLPWSLLINRRCTNRFFLKMVVISYCINLIGKWDTCAYKFWIGLTKQTFLLHRLPDLCKFKIHNKIQFSSRANMLDLSTDGYTIKSWLSKNIFIASLPWNISQFL